MNIRDSRPSPGRDRLDARLPAVALNPFTPTQRRPRSPGAAGAFLIIFLIRVIDPYAFVAGLADVTDGGAPQDGEIEGRFEIEVPAPAENTFFGLGDFRPWVFRADEAAIIAREIPLRPF